MTPIIICSRNTATMLSKIQYPCIYDTHNVVCNGWIVYYSYHKDYYSDYYNTLSPQECTKHNSSYGPLTILNNEFTVKYKRFLNDHNCLPYMIIWKTHELTDPCWHAWNGKLHTMYFIGLNTHKPNKVHCMFELAIAHGHLHIVKYLVSIGLALNDNAYYSRHHKMSALGYAAACGKLHIV